MSARKRDSAERSPASDSRMTYTEFMRRFPDNQACLDYLRDRFYPEGTPCPSCEKPSKFHPIRGRSAYSCQWCGHHVYPTAGTIFHKTTTSLQLWFWAVYLISSTRCGVSAKELGRELGVTYKTAWRMFNKIRHQLMDEDKTLPPLHTEVEADETFMGGKYRHRRRGHPGPDSDLTPVFGMVQRGGKVVAKVVPNTRLETLMPIVRSFVFPSTMIFTDESTSYPVGLKKAGYRHKRIRHSARIYVQGNVHTQTVEGFFGNMKTGIRGNYHSVSRKWLQGYLNEWTFRWNHRDDESPMFWTLVERVEKHPHLAAS